jgi:fructose 1,6-bisphosphatase
MFCICFHLTYECIVSLDSRQSTTLVLTQQKCLKETYSKFHISQHSHNTFLTWNGPKQVYFLLPLLNSALEYIFRKVQTNKGFKWHSTQQLVF